MPTSYFQSYEGYECKIECSWLTRGTVRDDQRVSTANQGWVVDWLSQFQFVTPPNGQMLKVDTKCHFFDAVFTRKPFETDEKCPQISS